MQNIKSSIKFYSLKEKYEILIWTVCILNFIIIKKKWFAGVFYVSFQTLIYVMLIIDLLFEPAFYLRILRFIQIFYPYTSLFRNVQFFLSFLSFTNILYYKKNYMKFRFLIYIKFNLNYVIVAKNYDICMIYFILYWYLR